MTGGPPRILFHRSLWNGSMRSIPFSRSPMTREA
jgi:hypothetical protein